IQVDVGVEPTEGPSDLLLGLAVPRGPDLGGDQGEVPASLERRPQQSFGRPVHGRGVEEVRVRLEALVDEGPDLRLTLRPATIERLPGADPDRRDDEPRTSQLP